jgi:RNA polymerase sigma-70 factor, ECF subfamily
MSMNVASLIERAIAGDQTALGRLLNSRRQMLNKLVKANLKPELAARIDVADVVQEALLDASRKLPHFFDEQLVPFDVWLCRVTLQRLAHIHRDHLVVKRRSIRREARVSAEDIAQSHQGGRERKSHLRTPSSIINDFEKQERARQLVTLLTEPDRSIIVMRFQEQKSVSEVASLLNMSLEAVRLRQFRALRKLQKLLGKDEAESDA